jgi:hypothetical protein
LPRLPEDNSLEISFETARKPDSAMTTIERQDNKISEEVEQIEA